jgi:hypothetical protein
VRISSIAGLAVLLGALLAGPAAASADPLPAYAGMSFPTIHGPADPEEYSWRVNLQQGQELKAIDDQQAVVDYNGIVMTHINAGPARDANGSAVPTSLSVSEADILTLEVHHRAGDPAAGGAPFDYPINAGQSFEVGFSSVIVIDPKEEAPVAEGNAGCVVPRLKGHSLRVDRRKLREAGCRLGEVRGARSRSAKVVKQYPRPGTMLGLDAEVSVRLGAG